MTDNTQPEAGSTHIIRYALELGLLWVDGDGRDKVREALDALDTLESQIEAIGAGGVQALSAAPEIHEPKCPALDGAGCTCAKHDPTIDRAWAQFCGGIGDGLDAPYPGMISAFERYYSQSFADKAWRNEASVWAAAWKAAMLAASPTPPAEQQAQPVGQCVICGSDEPFTGTCGSGDPRALCKQAAPKAAPGDVLDEALRERDDAEDFINELLDEVLGADRPEWSSAYNRYDAMSDVRERITALHKPAVDKAWGRFQSAMAAPKQEAQEPCPTCAALARTVMLDQVSFDRKPDCYGIRQITDDEGVEEWEDIRTSPDVAREEANDMMATGRGEIYEVVPLWTTPQQAPAPLSDEREAFESTWEKLYGKKPVLWDTAFKEAKMDVPAHSAGKYFYRDAQAAWKAWQARAALAAQGGAA